MTNGDEEQTKPYLNNYAKGIIVAASSGIAAILTGSLSLIKVVTDVFPSANSNLISNLATVSFAVVGLVVAVAFVVPEVSARARARAIWITATLTMVAGVSANVYFGIVPKSSVDGKETTFLLCVASQRDLCLSAAEWVPCGTDVASWAQRAHPRECARARYVKLSDAPGGACGYLNVEVVCGSTP